MLRRRAIVAAMAFATLFISSVEVTYAQPATNGEVELLVSAPAAERSEGSGLDRIGANLANLDRDERSLLSPGLGHDDGLRHD